MRFISLFAYLDPGSGSMMLQVLLGGLAGAAVFLKIYWKKFMALFSNNKKDDEKPSLAQSVKEDARVEK